MQQSNRGERVLISVCVLAYNHEAYIAAALDSILSQQLQYRLEIVIGEDYSTDKTKEIILAYAARHPHTVKPVLNKSNMGMMRNLSMTLGKCAGKYIAFLEGDDFWTDNNKLQKQVDFLENNPEYVITYTDSQAFDENGPVSTNFGGSTRDVSSRELVHGVHLYSLTTCFRNVVHGFSAELLSARIGDQVLWSMLGRYGKGKFLSDIGPSAYRVHSRGVISQASESRKLEMTLITCNALYAHYQRQGDTHSAQYFSERSFKLLRKMIGWRRLWKMAIQSILDKTKNVLEKIKH